MSETLDLAHLDNAGFDRLYNDRIKPCFLEHEPERLEAVGTFQKRFMLTAPLALAGGAGIGVLTRDIMFGVIAIAIAGVVAFTFSYLKLQAVADKVKVASLRAIAESIGVNYNPDVHEPPALRRFLDLKLLPGFDRSKYEDLFHGTYQDASFDLYEGKLETKSTDSKGRTSYSTVFSGQILRLAFPREFLGVTIVRRDAGIFNMFGADKKKNLKRVGLEDPKFEKIFEAYGTDQVEARYLLHPTFMQRLVDLEDSFKGKSLRCGFEDGDLLIAIEGGNLFEPGSMFEPLADPVRARKLVDELGGVMKVMDSVLTAQAKRPIV
jgi:hypothetical protein